MLSQLEEYLEYVDSLLSEPSRQPSRRICVELRSTHQANHAGVDDMEVWFLSTTVGDYRIFPIEANGIGHRSRDIVSGTSYFECVSMVAMSRVDTNPLELFSSASKLSTMI